MSDMRQTPLVPGLEPRDVVPTGQRAAKVADLAITSSMRLPIYERWLRFHEENPGIYRALEGLALYAFRQSPPRRFGVKALYEIARWEKRKGFEALGKKLGEDWQLPNDYTSMYARLLAEKHPEFLGDEFVPYKPKQKTLGLGALDTLGKPVNPYFEMRRLLSATWPVDDESVARRDPVAVEARAKESK